MKCFSPPLLRAQWRNSSSFSPSGLLPMIGHPHFVDATQMTSPSPFFFLSFVQHRARTFIVFFFPLGDGMSILFSLPPPRVQATRLVFLPPFTCSGERVVRTIFSFFTFLSRRRLQSFLFSPFVQRLRESRFPSRQGIFFFSFLSSWNAGPACVQDLLFLLGPVSKFRHAFRFLFFFFFD